MNYNIIFISAVLCMFAYNTIIFSQNTEPHHTNPFTHLGQNTSRSFSGTNLLWHSAAVITTFIIIQSDVDYFVHDYFSRNIETYDKYTTVTLWGGYIAPLTIGGGMYLWGKSNGNQKLYTAGCAVLQASAITLVCGSVLKAITGRPSPDPTVYTDMREASRIFRFGFLQGGIHYGWPSGHLMTNSAVITCLMSFYNKNTFMQIFGGLAIGYLIFGVSAHEGATMHWFSDVIAGTLMGCAIGATIGKDFRQMLERNNANSNRSGADIIPKISLYFSGINLSVTF